MVSFEYLQYSNRTMLIPIPFLLYTFHYLLFTLIFIIYIIIIYLRKEHFLLMSKLVLLPGRFRLLKKSEFS